MKSSPKGSQWFCLDEKLAIYRRTNRTITSVSQFTGLVLYTFASLFHI